jgi:hypothetical protein
MLNYSLSQTRPLPSRVHAHTQAHESSANNTHLLNFSKTANGSTPTSKSWFTKKVIPAVKRIGDIAGKVATVASIL